MNGTTNTYNSVTEIEEGNSKYNDLDIQKDFIPSIVFTVIMMLIGAPGNVVVFLVYLFKKKKSASRIFIIVLAACDSAICFFAMPVEIFVLANYIAIDNPVLCKLSRFLTFLSNDWSSVILVGIAVDRFYQIVLPLRKKMCAGDAKKIVFTGLSISVLVGWPSLLLYGTQSISLKPYENYAPITGKTCLIEDHMKYTKYPLIFVLVIMSCNIAVVSLLIFVYSVIAYKICVNNYIKQKEQLIKTTIMLFLVTVLFIIAFVPYWVIVFIRALTPEVLNQASNVDTAMYNLFLRAYFLSSGLNPVIYSFLSDGFRKDCKSLFLTLFRYLSILTS